jgi:hypothetical protein
MITETKETIIFVTDLMPMLEAHVLQQAQSLTLKQACLLGAGFGTSHGSDQLFKTFENIVADNYSNIDINGLRMVLHGLLFNQRISKNLLKALRSKY